MRAFFRATVFWLDRYSAALSWKAAAEVWMPGLRPDQRDSCEASRELNDTTRTRVASDTAYYLRTVRPHRRPRRPSLRTTCVIFDSSSGKPLVRSMPPCGINGSPVIPPGSFNSSLMTKLASGLHDVNKKSNTKKVIGLQVL